jgi:hypothetical protein
VGRLTNRIALPLDLVRTHDVFHVSMLRKYIANLDVIVEYELLEIQEGLTYIEELVKIVDKKWLFSLQDCGTYSNQPGLHVELLLL